MSGVFRAGLFRSGNYSERICDPPSPQEPRVRLISVIPIQELNCRSRNLMVVSNHICEFMSPRQDFFFSAFSLAEMRTGCAATGQQ